MQLLLQKHQATLEGHGEALPRPVFAAFNHCEALWEVTFDGSLSFSWCLSGEERRSIFFLREEAAFFAEQNKQNKLEVWRLHCSERPRRTLGFPLAERTGYHTI